MKQLRTILFVLVPVMLVLIAPTFLAADSLNQFGPEDYEPPTFPSDSPSLNGEIPSLEGGTPYRFPLVSTPADALDLDPAAADQLGIDIWYGDTQTFSELGSPQLWANIIGTVTGLDPENPNHELTYRLNGGPEQDLNIGPDLKRLYEEGEFNIELPIGDLIPAPGENKVLVRADDGVDTISKEVTVNYIPLTTWPMPYTADWSTLGGDISEGAQIVDGRWEIVGGKLALTSPGYDRLVTLGDYFWKDYVVTVPITVKSWNTTEWGPPSNGGGIGLAVRWRGHYQTADEQPRLGWSRLGALAWYRLEPKQGSNTPNSSFEMIGHGGGGIASRSDMQMEVDKTYIFKLSVQSSPFFAQPSTYRFKVWESGQPEPTLWTLSAVGRAGEPDTGSVLLVAHQVIAEYGDVVVTPLPSGPFTITNNGGGSNGQVIIEPAKPSYSYGETVEIRALGNSGYKLTGWTYSFSGSQNPIVIDVTQNLSVGANFGSAPNPPELNIAIQGNGSVNRDAQPPYLYGQKVTLTPVPDHGYIFVGWSGDLDGFDSPANIVLDNTKNITAKFVPANIGSPESDDFNACSLDTDRWTFIDPVGDGIMVMTGTELRLTAPAGVQHEIWDAGNNSVRVMQPTQNGSFEIVAKFDSDVTAQYQIQGILVEENAGNYLRFDTHFDGIGVRLYAAKTVNGTPENIFTSAPLAFTPSYLRVTRSGNDWTYSYSDNGTSWTTAGDSFSHTMNVTSSGVFSSNQGFGAVLPPAHTAVVDYFFNTDSPIVPEDGNQIGNFTIQVETLGEGTVNIQPDKATYQCNEVVKLTASPAAGWAFSGWSGDLSGLAAQQEIIVEKNYVITANFIEGTVPGGAFKTFTPMVTRD